MRTKSVAPKLVRYNRGAMRERYGWLSSIATQLGVGGVMSRCCAAVVYINQRLKKFQTQGELGSPFTNQGFVLKGLICVLGPLAHYYGRGFSFWTLHGGYLWSCFWDYRPYDQCLSL